MSFTILQRLRHNSGMDNPITVDTLCLRHNIIMIRPYLLAATAVACHDPAGAGNFTDILHCLTTTNGSNGTKGGCCGSSGSSSSRGWHSLSVGGTGPGPRGWFACTPTADGCMVVHGGLGADNERRGDMFMLGMHDD